MNRKKFYHYLIAAWGLCLLFCYYSSAFGQLKQPDPNAYSIERQRLFDTPREKMKTFALDWVIAAAKNNLNIYFNENLTGGSFNAAFLQQFVVLDKDGDKLKVQEKGSKVHRMGWAKIQGFVYLPIALKDKENKAFQKVVFTHRRKDVEPGKIGKVKFYIGPDENENYTEKSMGTADFFYVYAWQNSNYENSDIVLVGNTPQIIGTAFDERAFSNVLYGWVKTAKFFPWNSRIALIPNKDALYPPYVFNTGPDLKDYYEKIKSNPNYIPPDDSILFLDPKNAWRPGELPFFMHKHVNNPGEYAYWSLFIQLNPKRFVEETGDTIENHSDDLKKESVRKMTRNRAYVLTSGYILEKDPRSPTIDQFKNVFLFRRSEIRQVCRNLESILAVLNKKGFENLWKEFIERAYGEEYDPTRTLNDYAEMRGDITYKNLSELYSRKIE
jgi:hypothetical protein